MTRPVPPRHDLVTLLQACLHNAGDLLTDARLLLEAGQAPRAHALATLAFEETGKAFICIPALLPGGLSCSSAPAAMTSEPHGTVTRTS